MSQKVDISEVTRFSNDLQQVSEEIQSSLIKVKKEIDALAGLDSFSGKAAKEAKQYFSGMHETITESFRGLFDDLETNLEQHLEAFRSEVDVSETAIIRSNYLQDVQENVNDLFEDLVKQDEIIHDTIQEVSDISSATPPSFSDVNDYQNQTMKILKEVKEDLTSFNSKGNEIDVKTIISQIESSMNKAQSSEGQARFSNFEGASKVDALAKLQDYNADKQEERKNKIDSLQKKLANGEELSYTEREILYQHIQKNVLDEYDRAHMNEISIYMQHDNEKLTEYMNEEVLASEQSLENEIVILEQYLFAGNERPSDLTGKTEDRVALRSYLDVLKNHHTAINEVSEEMDWDRNKDDPLLARIEYANFAFTGDSEVTPNSHLESDITIHLHQDTSEDKGISREEFLEMELPLLVRRNHSEIEYYYGGDAVTDLMHKEGKELEEEVDTMTGEFLGSEILGYSLEAGGRAFNVFGNVALSTGNFLSDKKEKEDSLKWSEIKNTANKFNLEIKINTRDVPGSPKNEQVELNPSELTQEQMERWQAIHIEEPDFPYDEEAMKTQDWKKMYDLLYDDEDGKVENGDVKEPKEKESLNEHHIELLHYMISGKPEEDNDTVLKLWNRDR
ncbi:T7SS effector LXG polymorphic toxin [Oceanobacillus locisalsi]|uniref:T7SS effector LXG polymorphic toxin n=1 Tax=Oceanobacillus locisalsi TaxID=546107 RepID=A0ABW3NL21_9BACI